MDQIAKFVGSKFKQGNSRKTSTFASVMLRTLTVWITTNWKILQELGILDHLTCLLSNLYVGQEATVNNLQRTTDWLKIWKGVTQGCILPPYFFNLHAEYIMLNGVLDESQPRIKIAGRNINNLRYVDYMTKKIKEIIEELKN